MSVSSWLFWWSYFAGDGGIKYLSLPLEGISPSFLSLFVLILLDVSGEMVEG
jgi:hypothetical protein